MKAALLFAFLAVGFSAAVAAPRASTAVAAAEPNNLLIDIISAIIGVDIEAVIAQAEVTVAGLGRVLEETGVDLENIFVSSGQELRAEVQAILDDASAKAEVILEPIVTIVERILSLLGVGKVHGTDVAGKRDLVVDLIVALINRLIEIVETAVTDLQQLAIDTIVAIEQVAAQGGSDTIAALNNLAARALIKAVLEIQPLLDLLAPLLEPQDPSEIINELIKAILGLDVQAIVAQVDLTITGLDALFTSSANELNQILVSGGIDAQAQLQAVIDKANAEAEAILQPLINLINLIISLIPAQGKNGLSAVQRDLIGSIIEQLFQYIADSAARLEQLVVDTANELVQVAAQAGANTAGQIEDLAQQTVAQAQALIKPLLDLLDPIIPDARPQIAHLAMKRLH